jgi:hypothetical protein
MAHPSLTSGRIEVPNVNRSRWLPEEFRDWTPRTRLGWSIFRSLRYLPEELRAELLDRINSIVVMESRLALAVIRPYRGDFKVEDLGIVSYKVVTTAGVNYIASEFAGSGSNDVSEFNFHGIGTTNTAEAVGDTALAAEATTNLNPNDTRATGTQSNPSANVYRTVGTLTADGAIAAVEHGIFDQAATGGGTLLDRSVFSTVNLGSGDSLQATYDLTLTAGG